MTSNNMSRRSVIAALVSAPLAAAAFSPFLATAAGSVSPSALGMRASGGFPQLDRLQQYEQALGQRLRWYVAMADRWSPSRMRSSVAGQMLRDHSVLADRTDINTVMTVPLTFGKGDARTAEGRASIRARLRETAAGAWDEYFVGAAEALVGGGHGDAVIRLGHEFTGAWYPWSAQGNAAAYIAAYRHVHDVLARVSGDFRFDWNAARNTWGRYGPPAYPGDSYVDIVSMDVYYEPWKGDPSELSDDVWERRYRRPMASHAEFARQHSKPVAYPEWANGRVDQPRFISRMHDWMAQLPTSGPASLLYHSYFNVTNDKYDLDLYPKSKAKYLELFSAPSGGGDAETSSTSPSISVGSQLRAPVGTKWVVPATVDADSIVWWKKSGPKILWTDRQVAQPEVVFTSAGTYVLKARATTGDIVDVATTTVTAS